MQHDARHKSRRCQRALNEHRACRQRHGALDRLDNGHPLWVQKRLFALLPADGASRSGAPQHCACGPGVCNLSHTDHDHHAVSVGGTARA